MADYEMGKRHVVLPEQKENQQQYLHPNLFLEHLHFTCIQTNFFFLIFIVVEPSPQPPPPAPSFFEVGAGYWKIPYNLQELTSCTDKSERSRVLKMHILFCQHRNETGELSRTFKFFSRMIEKVQPAALKLHWK